MVPAAAAIAFGVGFVYWQTVVAAPALSFGSHGAIHFKDTAVAAGSEPLLCFDAVEWKRLCPGQTMTKLMPVNVSERGVQPVDLEAHTISTPTTIGKLEPKCRSTKIPAGLAPGIWKLSGHAASNCRSWLPLAGSFDVTVYAALPDTLVTIKAP